MTNEQQADAIVEFLFTNGAGQKADRLVLTVDLPQVHDLGGWCRQAVHDAIVAVLRGDSTNAIASGS